MYLNNEQIEASIGETHAWWLREILDDDEQVLWAARLPLWRRKTHHICIKIVSYGVLFGAIVQLLSRAVAPIPPEMQNFFLMMTAIAVAVGIAAGILGSICTASAKNTYAITDRRIITYAWTPKKSFSTSPFIYKTLSPSVADIFLFISHPDGGGEIRLGKPSPYPAGSFFKRIGLVRYTYPGGVIKNIKNPNTALHALEQLRTNYNSKKTQPDETPNSIDMPKVASFNLQDSEKLLWHKPAYKRVILANSILAVICAVSMIAFMTTLAVQEYKAKDEIIPSLLIVNAMMLACLIPSLVTIIQICKTHYFITTKRLIICRPNWLGKLKQQSWLPEQLPGLKISANVYISFKTCVKTTTIIHTLQQNKTSNPLMTLGPDDTDALKLLRNFIERRR